MLGVLFDDLFHFQYLCLIQGSYTFRKSGNIWEFDNYVQGPGNTRELQKICVKLGKLLEFKKFIPSIAKPKQSSYCARFLCRDPAGSGKLIKFTVA